MQSASNPPHAGVTCPHCWAFALHYDEVVLVRVVDVDERSELIKTHIFTLTANRCFWPYMSQNLFYLPRSSLLQVLSRDHQPKWFPYNGDKRSLDKRVPVSLPQAAWDLFMSIRDTHHARLKDRSLAARRNERWLEREDSTDDPSVA